MYVYNSNITSASSDYHYDFQVRPESTFEMANSTAEEFGCKTPGVSGDADGLTIRANNTIIENCTITNYPSLGVDYINSSGHKLSNSTLYNNHHSVQYVYTNNSILENCVFIGYGGEIDEGQQLILYDSCYNIISNCTFSNTNADAIALSVAYTDDYIGSKNNIITNCSFNMSAGCSSILMYYSWNNTVASCWMANSSRENGIEICGDPSASPPVYLTNNTIINCTIENNSVYGVCLSTANNNTVINCTIRNNSHGVLLEDKSENNTIKECTISLNDCGVSLQSGGEGPANNNRIYHNNFIDNVNNQSRDEADNYWDDGYPSGGNYWSDYTGNDDNLGVNQDELGSDGIGDTPYNITGNTPPNQDRYPLMRPYHTFTSELEGGWNFITLPLSTTTIKRAEDLAQQINNCWYVSNWNSSTQSFELHLAGTNNNNLTVELGIGYLVYLTQESRVTIGGSQIDNVTCNLVPGWNSIGWFNSTSITAESLANDITDCTGVACWDSNLIRFITHPTGTSISNFDLERGRGFMVHVISSK